MSQTYVCKDKACSNPHLENHGEAIEHLRGHHRHSFIKRPYKLGVPDSHGNYWYCFHAKCSYNKSGKDHRSFRSDRAMWDHLSACHDDYMDNIWPVDSVRTFAAVFNTLTDSKSQRLGYECEYYDFC